MDIISTFLPGDPRLIEQIVYELKSQGIFDQFRRECIADVDTKPAYQNLSQRVESSVMNFLNKQAFTEELNKNQLREQLRKNITESGFLESGVERIVDQVVNPKINSVFLPKVEDVVYKFLGIERRTSEPPKEEPTKAQPDLLPKDLEVVSPESVPDNQATESVKEDTNDSSINSTNTVKTEDESPPFEPLDETGEEVQKSEEKVGKVEVIQESNGNVILSDNDDNKMEICETSSESNDKESDITKVDVKENHEEVKVDKEHVKSDKEEVKRSDKRSSSDKHKSSRSERKDGNRSHSRDHSSKSSSRHSSSKDKDKKYGTSGSDKDKHSKDHHHHRRSSKDKSVRSEKSEKEHAEKKHKDEVNKEEKKSREDKSKDKSSGRHKSGSKDKERERSSKHKSSSSKDRDKDKSNSGKSKDKERSKEEKKKASSSEKKKIPDDHYALKDKKTERRSSDRDSNDGSSSKNSRNSSVGEGTGGAAVNLKSNTEEVFNSSPSTESGNTDTAAPFKLIKPKFASNIYEAMRLMKIRKRLAKLERQNQLALAQVDIDPKSLEGAGTVDELKQTDEVEETLRGQDLSMDDFEALEAKLAEEMAKFNANVYGEDEEEDEEEFVKESCHVTAETSMELPELVVNISSCDEQSVTEKRQQENPSSSKLDINENDSKEIKLTSDQKENLTSLNENFRGFTPDSVTDPQLAPLQKIIDKMQQDLTRLRKNSRANIVKVLKEELSQEAPECNPKAMLKLKLIFNELTMSNPAENLVQRNGKKLFLKVEKVKIEIPPKVLLCLEDMGFGEDRYNLFKTPNGLVSKGKRVINAKKRPRSVLASAEGEEEEEELCYFEGSEVNERTLKVLKGMMGKLERDIERLKLHMQNNIPTPKKRPGRKRKFQDTDGDGSTSSTPDSKKRLISENQTKTGVMSKRYSSDELYKPRPVLSTVNRRRSARNNNPQ